MTKKKKVLSDKFPIKNKDGLLNTKEKWINLFKGDKKRLLFIILISLLVIGLLTYIFYETLKLLIESFFEVINRNFGKFLASKLVALLFSSFFFGAILTVIAFWLIFSFTGKRINKWFTLTLYLISVSAIFGFFALDSVIGNPGLYLVLWGPNSTHVGEIRCEGPLGPIIFEDQINCKTDLNEKEKYILEEEKIVGVFTINNGERIERGLIALENTTYFGLEVYETNLNETQEKFTTGTSYSFMTKDEFEKNRERFLQAFLALMILTLVTIPIVVINFKKLWRDN